MPIDQQMAILFHKTRALGLVKEDDAAETLFKEQAEMARQVPSAA